MRGELPPNSGYTYAVELSADEAQAAGASSVEFSQPVSFYVQNFLNFPVGGAVPAGYYDRTQGVWVPSDNGRVIGIVSETGGLADVDSDGDGQADDAATLAALGVTSAERAQLATLYDPGQSLWRVPMTHFTPWDCNWPYGPPDDATSPNQPPPDNHQPEDKTCNCKGSIIEAENQILGERIDVAGTPFTLNYRSDRVPGNIAENTLTIPLSGATVPASLSRIVLEIQVAGRRITQTFAAAPNQTTTFTWDGLDVYGRQLQGEQPITVRIGYVYGAVYLGAAALGRAFDSASANGAELRQSREAQEVGIWQEWDGTIGFWEAPTQGLGGWTLDVNDTYDPIGQVLSLGDGTRRQRHGDL